MSIAIIARANIGHALCVMNVHMINDEWFLSVSVCKVGGVRA